MIRFNITGGVRKINKVYFPKNMKKKTAIITAVATVAAVGAAIFVVKKGPELKEDLLKKVDSLKEKIKDLEVSEVKDAIHAKLVEIKTEIKEFDWEKPKEEVEKKFHELKKQLKSVKKHLPLTQEAKDAPLIEEAPASEESSDE